MGSSRHEKLARKVNLIGSASTKDAERGSSTYDSFLDAFPGTKKGGAASQESEFTIVIHPSPLGASPDDSGCQCSSTNCGISQR
mmetsp:Transcript_26150/g.72125  ORF Transcript_26150/g.72125 Transcript_26150/m.72125 type:complete len:84 (+) Transcript_26150:924-1175(+)